MRSGIQLRVAKTEAPLVTIAGSLGIDFMPIGSERALCSPCCPEPGARLSPARTRPLPLISASSANYAYGLRTNIVAKKRTEIVANYRLFVV